MARRKIIIESYLPHMSELRRGRAFALPGSSGKPTREKAKLRYHRKKKAKLDALGVFE